jgi:hypothetical protein
LNHALPLFKCRHLSVRIWIPSSHRINHEQRDT